MSALRHLRDKNGDIVIENLPKILKQYKARIKDWKDDLSLTNKNLNDVLLEHHSIAAYYDEIKAELDTISSYFQMLMDKRAGIINEIIKETSKFDHSDRSIDKLIKKDEEYIMYSRLKLEVDELYKKVYYICRQFEQRSYTLSNIVKMFISELEDRTLTKEYD